VVHIAAAHILAVVEAGHIAAAPAPAWGWAQVAAAPEHTVVEVALVYIAVALADELVYTAAEVALAAELVEHIAAAVEQQAQLGQQV
jgi:hypothetical protein